MTDPFSLSLSAQSVAIFDGGLPADSPLRRWVNGIDAPGVGAEVPDYLQHGHDVTSAFLFGPIQSGRQLPAPLSRADHYRVLDADSADDLFDVLLRMRSVLESRTYDFINLSIGPEIPVEDTEVHAWTAFLDQHIYDARALVTVASGNGGERDRELGLSRVQTPADSVNALTIGASDSILEQWKRAGYSSRGPGRQPGVVKPDLLAFGGSDNEPFLVIDRALPRANQTSGTSFASPSVLRLGAGVRATLGNTLSTLAIKSLLIHSASPCSDPESTNLDHGWGRAAADMDALIICPPCSARVIYQGVIRSGEVWRAKIPLPIAEMQGMVSITATICYYAVIDPEHPNAYTRSALVPTFRPHSEKLTESGNVKTASFFSPPNLFEEGDLRDYAFKWETTMHASKTKRANSLKDSVFDIHHVSREAGAQASDRTPLNYALVLTVTNRNMPDIYNRVVQRYSSLLQPLTPVIQLPLRT